MKIATMDPVDIQIELENMKGKTFQYAGILYTVDTYTINKSLGAFTLITDRNRLTKKFEAAEEFFKLFRPVKAESAPSVPEVSDNGHPNEEEATAEDAAALQIIQSDNSVADKLLSTLMANIDQVKKDPKYIPQAQAVINSANSVMSVMRLKLDYIREMKGIKKMKGRR